MMLTKAEIRAEVRRRKRAMTAEARAAEAAAVMQLLEQTEEFQQAHRVLLYNSLPDELSTVQFLHHCLTLPDKEIFLPRVNGDDIDILPYRGDSSLSVGAFGISEPIGNELIAPGTIDLVVVPGVAFDRNGNRVGRGKGYYDRLLAQTQAVRIGVAYSCQIFDEVPAEAHDLRMHRTLFIA
jgi:5-formyltetrahydrofolate cyclo-ligase